MGGRPFCCIVVLALATGCTIDFDAPFAQAPDAKDAGPSDASADQAGPDAPDSADASVDRANDGSGGDGAIPDTGEDTQLDVVKDALEDAVHDGDAPDSSCPPNLKECGGTCVEPSDPEYGCAIPLDPADPCAPCPTPSNGTSVCTNDRCGVDCDPGWGDCDGSLANGCETSLVTTENCGGCGVVCEPDGGVPVCNAGQCEVVVPTWSYTHWRVDQLDGSGCGEWGKVTEVRFRVAGTLVVNAATGYASGTAGNQPVVAISHSGDSLNYGPAWKAFDGGSDAWQSFNGSYYWVGGEFLILQVGAPIVAQLVRVGTFWGSTKCARLSGSNDGSSWDVLGTECNSDCNTVLEFAP